MTILTGIAHMLQHPFLRYAFLAGTAIALASAWSATSSCCDHRCSAAMPSATWRSPEPSPPWPPESAF
jgi:hypothetical protein